MGIAQTDFLFVQDFLDILLKYNWINDDPEHQLHAIYERDTFSNVLETTTSIQLDVPLTQVYVSEINLYISNVGTVELDHKSISSQEIESIQLNTSIPVVISWLLYGLPEGGMVLPFYAPEDLHETNACPDRSHYIAYYDGGNTIIRAVIRRPIWINLWIAPVEIVYPMNEYLKFSARWIGKFERLDNTPCMIDR